jgi:hypothetical protein
MSYILNGKFYKGTMPKNIPVPHSLHKQYERDRGRENHQKEIIQPYVNNLPNQEFIDQYPDKAKEYGMIKDED